MWEPGSGTVSLTPQWPLSPQPLWRQQRTLWWLCVHLQVSGAFLTSLEGPGAEKHAAVRVYMFLVPLFPCTLRPDGRGHFKVCLPAGRSLHRPGQGRAQGERKKGCRRAAPSWAMAVAVTVGSSEIALAAGPPDSHDSLGTEAPLVWNATSLGLTRVAGACFISTYFTC